MAGFEFQAAPARLPAGERIYAIGDIHGCAPLLAALHAQIAEDLAARPAARALLVHVGDFVDKGPDSAGVIALLLRGAPAGLPMVNLMGNHERTMLDALGGERAAVTDFRMTGGVEALASWGIDAASDPAGWAGRLPPDHLGFLNALSLTHRHGPYLFVHAGIRPGVPLEQQEPDDLLRIRHGFLESPADFGCIVVHGHTPSRGPVVRANRIGIDTGAVFGRELTCVVLEDDRLGFLSVSATPST
jgi:serine/threonine protein phosphatase 1